MWRGERLRCATDCKTCGGPRYKEQISCPDQRPGCAVAHYKIIGCPACGTSPLPPSPPKDLMSVANSEERDVLRRLEWAAEQFDNYDVCCDNSGCSGCDGRGDSNECLTLAQDVKEQAQWLRSFAASYSPLVRETLPEIKQNVPGQIACHAIVTGACRANRGRFHAVTEALDRLKNEYDAIMMEDWPYETKLHFVLSIERAPVSTDTNTVNTANGSALPPETGS